jgi:hypothetical protein
VIGVLQRNFIFVRAGADVDGLVPHGPWMTGKHNTNALE